MKKQLLRVKSARLGKTLACKDSKEFLRRAGLTPFSYGYGDGTERIHSQIDAATGSWSGLGYGNLRRALTIADEYRLGGHSSEEKAYTYSCRKEAGYQACDIRAELEEAYADRFLDLQEQYEAMYLALEEDKLRAELKEVEAAYTAILHEVTDPIQDRIDELAAQRYMKVGC